MAQVITSARVGDLFGTYWESGHLVVEGDRIARAGPGPAPAVPGAEVVDAGGRLVTPGLVNAHAHLYSALARGVPLRRFDPTSFGEILEQLWWKLDRALDLDGVYHSGVVGALGHLRAGVTALFDHHASPTAIEGSLAQLKRALIEVGLRADLCYEVTDRGGSGERDAGIAENVRFAREDRIPGFTSAHMGLHASFTLSDETLGRARAAAEELGLGYHVHLAEGKEDPVDALHKHGVRTAERLDRFGILGEESLLVHGIQLSGAELDLLAARGGTVVHNPRSNMNNAVGAAPVLAMLGKGIRVALGTDGFGSDLLTEALTARLLAHHASGSPTTLPDPQLLGILRENYRLAERAFGVPMGKVTPGFAADLVVWDYVPPTPLDAGSLLSHLLFGSISEGVRPRTVLVAGVPRLRDGVVTGLDERTALAAAREAARALWGRI
ncbi:MAG: Previously annotated as SsnA protein [Candidatus Bipolaricaulis sibiricus]|uniref:Previously annotated as SsnA protein n=1 Tax=Bipolaricaulis sibiricus TaxID=2501609 RepID=A0A410FSH1_BIPS1|nr:MAG: Previously annotated as SsnA protein [Candidatus Bipolaricaulis sibiricus]